MAESSHHEAIAEVERRGLAKHQAFNSRVTDMANSKSGEVNRLSERVQSNVEHAQTHLMKYAHKRAELRKAGVEAHTNHAHPGEMHAVGGAHPHMARNPERGPR